MIGCDWLIYQDLADLEAAVAGPKFPGRKFDSSCFSGEYVTGVDRAISSASASCARTTPSTSADWRCDAFLLPFERRGGSVV